MMPTGRRRQRPRGRPKLGKLALLSPVMVRFPRALLKEIDAMAATRLDRPSRSAIVRELIAEALAKRATRSRGRK
ncbi:ribbon-helix-helix protein, CopG family [Hyphomicrobium sp. 1Nfss2.1]|uniref:ribbon-helix-helix protein, CopG family n=1 Tax=Hyphomicrobium sp. 1Nfss2.1 TaxID=3413936 RepID=UPI003C79EA39